SREALGIHRLLGRRMHEPFGLTHLGWIAMMRGEYDRAVVIQEEALAITRELRDDWATVMVLRNLGEALARGGKQRQALAVFAESLRLDAELDNPVGIGFTLETMTIALAEVHPEAAARLLAAGLAQLETLGAAHPPGAMAEIEALAADLEDRLGKETFSAASEAGKALSREAAMAEALTLADEIVNTADTANSSDASTNRL
ncbi:MAG: transcriptional regulator, LuxR family, partial [Thermomicrobiales bacterium]|nr:transcriptional regulator, LuxR family [Thermomicrobiales bacterium]